MRCYHCLNSLTLLTLLTFKTTPLTLLTSLTLQKRQQAGAAAIEEIEHKLEAFGAFVVWVGDIIVAHGHVDELSHRHNLIEGFGAWCQSAQIGLVVGIHWNYDIEIVEVGLAYLTAAMGQLEPTAAGMHTHAVVGKLTDVIAARTGRIDMPAILLPGFFYHGAEHAFSRRRTAYITEAYE